MSIVFVVMLLIVQATCELSLPDYTSNIVNIGIQQNGIENAVPKVVSETELNKLAIFMSDDEKQKIKENYDLLDKNKLSKEEYEKELKNYPLLKEENIYKLNTKDKEKINSINDIFEKSLFSLNTLEFIISENTKSTEDDIDKIILNLPKDKKNQIINEIDKKLDSIDKNMISQSSIQLVKEEYQNIGININKLQTNYVLSTGFKMLLIAFISMIATVWVGFIASKVSAGLGKNIRNDVFGKVMSFSNSEFDKFQTASLITRSTNDIQQIQTVSVMLIRMVFYAPILAIGGIIKVLNTDTSMAWIIGVAVVSIFSVVIVLFGLAIPRFKKVQQLIDKLNLVSRETLTGMLVIRAFSNQKVEEERFDETNAILRKTNIFVNRIATMMMPLMMLIMNLITLLIVWVGANKINEAQMQVGDMMAFIQYTMQIIMSFLFISMLSVIIPRASVSAKRISEILETDVLINDPKEAKEFKVGKGHVEFKNVSFKYKDAKDNVLSNINFVAKPGETTAIIGSTGSGKSTLVNLIPRFYDVTDGEILVDGINIKEVKQSKLREKIGYVPQKGVLFSGTIESNIKYSNDNLSDEDVIKASKISQSIEFIDKKPEKFKSEISQGGTNVSGGQKQRLSIARCIAKKPDIYIFDDSFSALDLKTDATLRKELKSETTNSTVIIVAQRISTIMNAEQIIVLDEGKIVGKGTHEELIKNCEVYKQIASSQLSKEDLDNEK